MKRRAKRSTRASRARARALARARRGPWLNAGHWTARRQAWIDQLGTKAFTRKRGDKPPLWIDMAEAGARLGCSPAAARKRLQRDGTSMMRVGGRWLVRRVSVAVRQPNFGLDGQPQRRLTARELAKTFRGRGGRPLTTQGVRRFLQRNDLGHKAGGRWVANDLLAVAVEAERQRLCEPVLTTSGRADTTNAF